MPRTKELVLFGLHTIFAMVVCTFLGGLTIIALGTWLTGGSENALLDAPYSPCLWGLAALAGFFLTRLLPSGFPGLVWIAGVAWLLLWIIRTLPSYDPRWCMGCSESQYLWFSFFSYRNCMQECLGQMFVTAPMLSSIAYSIGAFLSSMTKRRVL
jgi:hypothetical protein